MIRFLLDTNTVSEPARARPDARVERQIDRSHGEMAIGSVVWLELLHGFERMPLGRKREQVGAYLDRAVRRSLPILPFDRAAAEWLARERARLDTLGRPRPLIDGQIAAVAATRGLTLVTRNVADFEGYAGLAVENGSDAVPGEDPATAHP